VTVARKHLRHGTIDGYFNHGCRCAACKAVGAEYMRDRRRRASSYKPKPRERP
jgi:hypothetical protein